MSILLNYGELSETFENIRASGKSIVQCHGVFDIFHIGHKRHLKDAKSKADVLVVSITSDKYVLKGPGKPIFSEDLRAELIASIDCVDYVYINDYPDAIPAIKSIKPNIFYKGDEYKNEADDITGKISLEKDAVTSCGGTIQYSSEITFSSSNLAKRSFSQLPEEALDFLEGYKSITTFSKINKELERAKKLNILVIGEVIIDRYTYVNALNRPSKENIISTSFSHSRDFIGGVVPVVNLANFYASNVDLCTLIGKLDKVENRFDGKIDREIGYFPFFGDGDTAITKERFVDPNNHRKQFEINFLENQRISESQRRGIDDWLEENAPKYDVVLACDFGHGLIERNTAVLLSEVSKSLCLNVQTNSANRGFNYVTKFPKADFIVIDEPEARLATQNREDSLNVVASEIIGTLDARALIITNGKKGALICDADGLNQNIPAFNHRAIDTMGAGDAFFSMSSVLYAASGDVLMAGFCGNLLASLQVESVGQAEGLNDILFKKYLKSMMA